MNRVPLSILIIEDNAQLAANIYDYLEACGHSPDAAPDGLSGLHLAQTRDYDAIILDWNLPRLDGLSMLRRLRSAEGRRMPVVMLTARDQLADKFDGFEAGLDDYLVKPIALPELELRIRFLVQRIRGTSVTNHELRVADLTLNLSTLEAKRGNRPFPLSKTGRRLLELLMRESPAVVTRQRLEQAAWGEEPPESDLLRSHMYVLRRAIEQDQEEKLLHTHSGAGYSLHAGKRDHGA
ncbi:response regulator transcription factor [[Pseudomonas] boreopolis]|uniref:response regulator transcription factor n=1 Tax=Xanthomonas boreopolis TaxID=86183 RepID=UPI003D9AD86C